MVVLLLAGCTSPTGPPADAEGSLPPFPPTATFGATRLFARVGEPGYPEGLAVAEEVVYVGSASRELAGAVFVYERATGLFLRSVTLQAAQGADGTLVVGLALDGAGRVYAADIEGRRVVRLDFGQEPPRQEVYAEAPDLPVCAAAPGSPCEPTAEDRAPLVNQPAFGPDGALYLSDSFQATVFRVPPGGGPAEPWFQDARLASPAGFGANGLALSPDDRYLYIAQSDLAPALLVPAAQPPFPGGAVWRVPLQQPTPEALELVRAYPGGHPDGIAFGASGRLYVAIIDGGLTGHGVSVLGPDGAEEAFFPSAAENAALEVPFDGPATLGFLDERRSLLVANQATTAPERWAVLESFVDDTALPLHRPR